MQNYVVCNKRNAVLAHKFVLLSSGQNLWSEKTPGFIQNLSNGNIIADICISPTLDFCKPKNNKTFIGHGLNYESLKEASLRVPLWPWLVAVLVMLVAEKDGHGQLIMKPILCTSRRADKPAGSEDISALNDASHFSLDGLVYLMF